MIGSDITIRFVRPDRLMYEGKAHHVVLQTYKGEFAIYPGHAPEIVALGDGVVRINRRPEDGGDVYRILVSGGYAEVSDDTVIVLADHGRRMDDIDPVAAQETLERTEQRLAELDPSDHRSAYYENKLNWCKLLLKYAPKEPGPQA